MGKPFYSSILPHRYNHIVRARDVVSCFRISEAQRSAFKKLKNARELQDSDIPIVGMTHEEYNDLFTEGELKEAFGGDIPTYYYSELVTPTSGRLYYVVIHNMELYKKFKGASPVMLDIEADGVDQRDHYYVIGGSDEAPLSEYDCEPFHLCLGRHTEDVRNAIVQKFKDKFKTEKVELVSPNNLKHSVRIMCATPVEYLQNIDYVKDMLHSIVGKETRCVNMGYEHAEGCVIVVTAYEKIEDAIKTILVSGASILSMTVYLSPYNADFSKIME